MNEEYEEGLKTWITPISKGQLLHWLGEFGLDAKIDIHSLMKYIRSGELDMSKEDCDKYFSQTLNKTQVHSKR